MSMPQKKFILAHVPYIFDSMADMSARLVALAEEGKDLSSYVIGSYIGSPEISTSIAVNIGGKTKRINKSNTKLVVKQVAAEPKAKQEAPEIKEVVAVDAEENEGICSFCGKPWVRKTVLEGFNTYLCDFHLKLETQLASITS